MDIKYTSRKTLHIEAFKKIKKANRVMDIGCGLKPIRHYKPKLHIMVEPCEKYADVLADRFVAAEAKGVLILKEYADTALEKMPDGHVDVIYILDVIEHIEKDIGTKILKEAMRVCREQVIVFTPLGFMPQEDDGGPDGWGVEGVLGFQEHLSGWLPEEFGDNWSHIVCEEFHLVGESDHKIDRNYGAFWAIYNKPKPELTKKTKEAIFFGRNCPPSSSPQTEAIYSLCAKRNILGHSIVLRDFSPYGKALQNMPNLLQGQTLSLRAPIRKKRDNRLLFYIVYAWCVLRFLVEAAWFNFKNRAPLISCCKKKREKLLLWIIASLSLKIPKSFASFEQSLIK